MKAFMIFKIFGEGDGYSVFDFQSIHSTIELAQKAISESKIQFEHMDLLDKAMTKENNYTIIDKRPEYGNTQWNRFGGYIIEEIEIK